MTQNINKRVSAPSILKKIESADLLMEKEKYEQALAIYDILQHEIFDEYKIDKTQVYFNLGKCYLKLDNKEKSIECYKKSLDYAEEYQLGFIFKMLGYLYYHLE